MARDIAPIVWLGRDESKPDEPPVQEATPATDDQKGKFGLRRKDFMARPIPADAEVEPRPKVSPATDGAVLVKLKNEDGGENPASAVKDPAHPSSPGSAQETSGKTDPLVATLLP